MSNFSCTRLKIDIGLINNYVGTAERYKQTKQYINQYILLIQSFRYGNIKVWVTYDNGYSSP